MFVFGGAADTFTLAQAYAIIVLPNGGPDLEAYTFEGAAKTGWRQACSLFWQVTRTLADAEDTMHFEVPLSISSALAADTEIEISPPHSIATCTGARSW